ncbi:6-phosphofructokinase 1 [mine drainage metagenome]|uniref:6-phosphofructokinase n=1 Tax=mine drainage metagenome TaxID=410659 RepID=A0A1J5TCV4_9ZZZZ
MKPPKRIGILTAGGDSPGLNAAIRAVGKAMIGEYGWEMIGFRDGFLGLASNRYVKLGKNELAGILTLGGTFLGTSRDKPHRMTINGHERNMLGTIAANYRRLKLDALICIGGGGTHKNALRLVELGLRVLTLPKTIDNDVAGTDVTIGFDTALGIASEAIDRLHSTAHSHHRIVVAEIMGHNAGWLALGAGIASGADVILIPEIAYDVEKIAAAIRRRSRHGTNFSIVAVAEGAKSIEDAALFDNVERRRKDARTKEEKEYAKLRLTELETKHAGNTMRLARQLEELTKLESRVTILGYVQRGGTPSTADRILATRLGTACARLAVEGAGGVMVAARGEGVKAVPIAEVAGNLKLVARDHSWVQAARAVGTSLGD